MRHSRAVRHLNRSDNDPQTGIHSVRGRAPDLRRAFCRHARVGGLYGRDAFGAGVHSRCRGAARRARFLVGARHARPRAQPVGGPDNLLSGLRSNRTRAVALPESVLPLVCLRQTPTTSCRGHPKSNVMVALCHWWFIHRCLSGAASLPASGGPCPYKSIIARERSEHFGGWCVE